eukprot:1866453-Pyramimonas_sp.AAC.1
MGSRLTFTLGVPKALNRPTDDIFSSLGDLERPSKLSTSGMNVQLVHLVLNPLGKRSAVLRRRAKEREGSGQLNSLGERGHQLTGALLRRSRPGPSLQRQVLTATRALAWAGN